MSFYASPFLDKDGDGAFVASVVFETDFAANRTESILDALDIWESVSNVAFVTPAANAENTISFDVASIGRYWGYAYPDDSIDFSINIITQCKRIVLRH